MNQAARSRGEIARAQGVGVGEAERGMPERGGLPFPGAILHVRDLWPHSLQIEHRCGLFFLDGPPPIFALLGLLAPELLGPRLLLAECSMVGGGTSPEGGICRTEIGLPTGVSCRCLFGGDSNPVLTRSTSVSSVVSSSSMKAVKVGHSDSSTACCMSASMGL